MNSISNRGTAEFDYDPPENGWMDPSVDFRKGTYCYNSAPKNTEYLGMPNPREWSATEEDWKLPENWKEIIHRRLKERLRSIGRSKSSWTSASDAAPARTNATSSSAR